MLLCTARVCWPMCPDDCQRPRVQPSCAASAGAQPGGCIPRPAVAPAVAPALIHLCRKVFPQPKLRERSFPVPRGMTATEGAGSSFSSRMVPSSHATVPSPPAAKMRRRLQPVGASYADVLSCGGPPPNKTPAVVRCWQPHQHWQVSMHHCQSPGVCLFSEP